MKAVSIALAGLSIIGALAFTFRYEYLPAADGHALLQVNRFTHYTCFIEHTGYTLTFAERVKLAAPKCDGEVGRQ